MQVVARFSGLALSETCSVAPLAQFEVKVSCMFAWDGCRQNRDCFVDSASCSLAKKGVFFRARVQPRNLCFWQVQQVCSSSISSPAMSNWGPSFDPVTVPGLSARPMARPPYFCTPVRQEAFRVWSSTRLLPDSRGNEPFESGSPNSCRERCARRCLVS